MTVRSKFAVLVAIAAIACTASLAFGAAPKNGGFEDGSLNGWKTFTAGESSGSKWYVYKKGDEPGAGVPLPRHRGGDPGTLYPPPQGKFAAYGLGNGGGPRILYRTLHLKPGRKIQLSMQVFYKNLAKAVSYTHLTLPTNREV